MKIGILIPRSTLYPSIGFDFLDGLKASLDLHQPGHTHTFVTENIGFGGIFPEVASAVEKLLIQQDADLVVGYLHHEHAEVINNILAAAGKIALALDSGYELPISATHHSHIFKVSLSGYVAARQAVKVAVAQGVRNVVASLSYYDAGYRMPVAFATIQQQGGFTKGTYVTPLKTVDFTLQPLIDHLQKDMPDAVFASFCQEMAIQFFEEAAKHEAMQTPKVVGASFMLEDSYLAGVKWPGFPVQGCATWARNLDNAANAKAQAHMKAHRKKELNLFSLLSWEVGQLIAQYFPEGTDTDQHMASIKAAVLESPRGRVVMDARNHTLVAPIYDVFTQPSAEGFTEVAVKGESQGWKDEVEAWYDDVANEMGVGSTWRNLYTCI